MNLKFINKTISLSISKKIRGSFFILILVVVLNGIYTSLILNDSINVLNVIYEKVNPTLSTMNGFKNLIKDSKAYSTNWVYINTYEQDKEKLKAIHSSKYSKLRKEVLALVDGLGDQNDAKEIRDIIMTFDKVLNDQKSVMQSLGSSSDYEDPMTIFMAEDLIENTIIPRCDEIVSRLDKIILEKNEQSEEIKNEMLSSFHDLQWVILFLGILGVLFALLISNWLSYNITKPIKILLDKITLLAKGKIPGLFKNRNRDEVSQMGLAINLLINGFRNSSEFAAEITKGNLDATYEALSEEDVLGKSILAMRDNLINVIDETNKVVKQAGSLGHLNARINAADKSGAWKDLSESINTLLESVSTPIVAVNEIVNAMAMGDLTQRYSKEAKGEILSLAENLNSALENLNGFLNQISDNANMVDDSAEEMLGASEEMGVNTGEIASAIAEMSDGAQTQVSKVDETSTLIEGILKSSNDMRERAREINEGVSNVVTNSGEGEKMLDQVVSNMTEISTYSQKTNDSIKVLTLRSDEISRVLGVITEIASQTNLLALNAAIEAAQAGDAGRGFAVVAEEIRKLAEDSRNSAQQIEKLIGDVQADTKEAASVIETMNSSVKIGEQTSNEAVQMFKKIADRARNNLDLSQNILNATQAQEKDINEVVANTESVVVVAEQTATGTEEIATSATELSAGMENYTEKSEKLTQIASELKIGVAKFKLSSRSN